MTEAYPLQWPPGWPRTKIGQHETGYQFKKSDSSSTWGGKRLVTFTEARDSLYEELARIGANNPTVSSNHPTGRYGIPTESKRRVDDDGIAVYFTLNDKPMVMACDRYQTAAANMRSLALAIEALRQLERHGGGTMMERAFTGFAALPAPKSPYEVLGIRPGASIEEIADAHRQKAKKLQAELGSGATVQMAELNAARDKLKEQAA
jgi:hypothetical protein